MASSESRRLNSPPASRSPAVFTKLGRLRPVLTSPPAEVAGSSPWPRLRILAPQRRHGGQHAAVDLALGAAALCRAAHKPRRAPLAAPVAHLAAAQQGES